MSVMQNELRDEVRKNALETGAIMVGFAPAARFKHAPKVYHPESFVPGAKTVVVVGVHYPDACVENCGEDDLQEMGTRIFVTAMPRWPPGWVSSAGMDWSSQRTLGRACVLTVLLPRRNWRKLRCTQVPCSATSACNA